MTTSAAKGAVVVGYDATPHSDAALDWAVRYATDHGRALLIVHAAGVPVVLDGVIAGSAALVAQTLAPMSIGYCFAGHRSVEPGHRIALAQLGLRPLVDLDLRLGEGTGAVLAFPIVEAAGATLREMATFDSAGVARK